MTQSTMTARQISDALITTRWEAGFVLPNYTPRNWWECDLFELTKAGYFREYEIKVSLSDFKADAQKLSREWKHQEREYIEKHKHGLIGQPVGPCRFWYVCPAGLLTPEIVPTWAGLITVERRDGYRRLTEHELKPAPNLHRVKCDEQVVAHARGVCYWRMHRIMADHRR